MRVSRSGPPFIPFCPLWDDNARFVQLAAWLTMHKRNIAISLQVGDV